MIAEFDPAMPINPYVSNWIEKNGKKLFQNAVDIEYAWNTLDELGLREKLIKLSGNSNVKKSLAWWMAKEPLRTQEHPKEHDYKTHDWKNPASGLTAGELGITTVAHETSDFEAYEAITRSPLGKPNLFVSRKGAADENAAFGDGLYTMDGSKGARGTGFHVRFSVDPQAREGIDFIPVPEVAFFGNAVTPLPSSRNRLPLIRWPPCTSSPIRRIWMNRG